MDDQRKDQIDLEGPTQEKCRKLQTDNLPTDDVENINRINVGRDLLLATKPRIVTWGTEKMLQRIQRHNRVTLHRSAHPKREQYQTENLAMAWIDYKKLCDIIP